MITHYPCIVVADGLFPTAPFLLERLHKASVIIACDGAIRTLQKKGITPTAIVGDMDSIPHSLREKFADRLFQENDQEINDLTKAVHYAHRIGQKEILILGATGKREDHTLGNISLLMDYQFLFDRVEMASDFGVFTAITQTTYFPSFPGQQVSLISLYPGGKITTDKLKYPLFDHCLTSWWQGTLNESQSEEFGLILSNEARFIVFRTYFSPLKDEQDHLLEEE